MRALVDQTCHFVDRLLVAVGQDGTTVPPERYQVPSRHFGIFSANGECNTVLRIYLASFAVVSVAVGSRVLAIG